MKLNAVMLLLLIPAGARAQSPSAPLFGASLAITALPRPYAFTCSDNESAALAVGVQGGVKRGAFTFTANLARARKVAEPACVVVTDEPVLNGTFHSKREFRPSAAVADGITPLTLRAGYTVGGMMTASLGGGLELARRDPILVGSLLAHAPGRFKIYAGVQAMYLRAAYDVLQRQYQNDVLVNADTVESGHAWRRSLGLVVGFQQLLR